MLSKNNTLVMLIVFFFLFSCLPMFDFFQRFLRIYLFSSRQLECNDKSNYMTVSKQDILGRGHAA